MQFRTQDVAFYFDLVRLCVSEIFPATFLSYAQVSWGVKGLLDSRPRYLYLIEGDSGLTRADMIIRIFSSSEQQRLLIIPFLFRI